MKTSVLVFFSHLSSGPSELTSVFVLFFYLCPVSAHWLQWEAHQPADVHWNSRWPLLEATCLLPSAQDHWENRCHGQPRNIGLQHKSSRNSPPSRKQHVSQVGVKNTSGYIIHLGVCHHEGSDAQWKITPFMIIQAYNIFQRGFYRLFSCKPTRELCEGNIEISHWEEKEALFDYLYLYITWMTVFTSSLVSLTLYFIGAFLLFTVVMNRIHRHSEFANRHFICLSLQIPCWACGLVYHSQAFPRTYILDDYHHCGAIWGQLFSLYHAVSTVLASWSYGTQTLSYGKGRQILAERTPGYE